MNQMFLNSFHANSKLVNFFYGCITFLLVKNLFSFIQKLGKLPPGPWGLPIVGYLPFIEKSRPYLHLTELAKKYGPIYSFKCGQFDLVIINGWQSVQQALANDDLLARPKATFIPGVIEKPSIVEMSGDTWKEHRRVAMTTLRNVGLGKSTMEEKIKAELSSFISLIQSFDGKPFPFMKKSNHSLLSNISTLLFGHTFDLNDPFASKLKKIADSFTSLVSYFHVAIFIPWIVTLAVNLRLFNLSKMRVLLQQFESQIYHEVSIHQTKETSHEIEDYIDGFLIEMRKRHCDVENDDSSPFNLGTLVRNVCLFYGAGVDSVAFELNWIMLYLVEYPECQEKIRNEIKEKIGFERLPGHADRLIMPYTIAFIYEAQRMSSTTALNPLRRATRDTKVGNKIIPKDTLVTLNLWSVHRDPDLWDEPESFKPERFLNKNGFQANRHLYLVSFGAGKRACPGKSFAELEIFLYLVALLQKFEISVPIGAKISFEDDYLFQRKPKHPIRFLFKSIG